jgi:hypothetical protein
VLPPGPLRRAQHCFHEPGPNEVPAVGEESLVAREQS